MKMLIGLTGKSGSGKTTAARIFENLGAFVVDCDKIAHEIINTEDIKKLLTAEFSEAILSTDGKIDRKKLGSIVFTDEKKLHTLNAVMHPAIVEKALSLCENSGRDICVIDGSELESSGAYKKCRYTVVITADEKIRLKRITARDGISTEKALERIRAQKDCSIEAVFIENNEDEASLKDKISVLYNNFLGEINAQGI